MKIDLNPLTLEEARLLRDNMRWSDHPELRRVIEDLDREILRAEDALRARKARQGPMRRVVNMEWDWQPGIARPWRLLLDCGHSVRHANHRHTHCKPPKRASCPKCATTV